MYHQLTCLCSGIYQNSWVLTSCCWAQLINSSPKPVSVTLLTKRKLELEGGMGQTPSKLQQHQLFPNPTVIKPSKLSKSSFCLTQSCWGGDRHRESQQSPLLIILGSPRGFFWEPLGIWRSSCHQAVNRTISCAHWGKRWRIHPVL